MQLYGDAKLSVKMTINSVVGVPLSRAKQQRETRSGPEGCGDFGFEPNSPSESSSEGRRRKRREKDSQDSTCSPLEEHQRNSNFEQRFNRRFQNAFQNPDETTIFDSSSKDSEDERAVAGIDPELYVLPVCRCFARKPQWLMDEGFPGRI